MIEEEKAIHLGFMREALAMVSFPLHITDNTLTTPGFARAFQR